VSTTDVEGAPESETADGTESPGYARRLTLFDGVMVVAGGIIGAGIFQTPAVVAEHVDTPALIMAAWAIGGAIALIGALCFAELGARRPEAGGGYVYLREAFSPVFGFLYGWKLVFISSTGAIAALGIVFANYTIDVVGLANVWPTRMGIAVAAILFLSAINYFGIRFGSLTQNIFTVLKLAVLAGLVGAGLWLGAGELTTAEAASQSVWATGGTWGIIVAIGAALTPVLFSHGGWQHMNHIAAEIKQPNRNLPLSLLIGVGIVVGTYLLTNYAFLYALGVEGLAGNDAPATAAMEALVGDVGGKLIGIGVMVSVFGILNLIIMAAPRVTQAMAEDELLFEPFARLHPEYRTPMWALLFQAVWSILLLFSGTFSQLLNYVVFGDWILFALIVGTLFVYRRRDAATEGEPDSYRMIGYPVLPVFFILASLFVVGSTVYSTVQTNPENAVFGAGLILLGIPVYYGFKRRGKAPHQSE
jgi:APA family basic amino acid/polyamine antiporter